MQKYWNKNFSDNFLTVRTISRKDSDVNRRILRDYTSNIIASDEDIVRSHGRPWVREERSAQALTQRTVLRWIILP